MTRPYEYTLASGFLIIGVRGCRRYQYRIILQQGDCFEPGKTARPLASKIWENHPGFRNGIGSPGACSLASATQQTALRSSGMRPWLPKLKNIS